MHANRSLTLSSGSTIERASGGSGNDMLFGNSLDNLLIGNGGNDILAGELRKRSPAGRSWSCDLLIGGLGRDTLEGDADDDILIAGRTTNDGLPVNLSQLRIEWTSSSSYSIRVSRLRAGVGTPTVFIQSTNERAE
ncbi:MAG: M10 family metallopeptidase C-terminal domain-containing protein [Planctomycetaceae bacterium]